MGREPGNEGDKGDAMADAGCLSSWQPSNWTWPTSPCMSACKGSKWG